MQKIIFSTLFLLAFQFFIYGQEPTDPAATEDWSRKPVAVSPLSLIWPKPFDAIVLLDANTCLWTKPDGTPIGWTNENGVITVKPGTGSIVSMMKFEDCHLHIEWRSPVVIKGTGQGRGNSGVFLQGRYEVQVLDSYDNETYFNGQAGSVYKQAAPLVNAMSKPGDWNIYDIIYKAPKFDRFGKQLDQGRITVIHNGFVIQNNVSILGTTEYIGYPKNPVHMGGPIMLQDHSDLVSYRNIWVRRL